MAEQPWCVAQTSPVPLARGITEAEFEQVVRHNQRRIFRLLLVLVRDTDTAENLTQDCFLRAYQKRASYRGEASVSTWLTRIAINLARDYGRSRRVGFWRKLLCSSDEAAQLAAGRVPDTGLSAEQQLLRGETVTAVFGAMGRLTPQQREVFVLRFVEDMSVEEVAAAMGREVGTVKTHLHRAVQRIRAAMKEAKGK
jgi:RNA polymerase sigma-70 factor (ECF subfamily)